MIGPVNCPNGPSLAAFRRWRGHGNRSVSIRVKICGSLIKRGPRLFIRGVRLLKRCGLSVAILALIVSALAVSQVKGFDLFELYPTTEHHVAALNSNLPYVAGFHVIADDLSLRETVKATAVTISFPSTEPDFFPSGCWLGGGMFVQAQDHVFRNVDYGFYMMLALDASGRLFVDLGLHQTEEATLPSHMPMSTLVYAYTWQIIGIDRSTPITLLQSWDSNGVVDYSLSVSGLTETIIAINVTGIPNCQNIIPTFYAGNVVIDPFPFSRYINYFQFGVISSQAMTDTHWRVDLKEPKMLRQTGWTLVDKAWSFEGNHSYLDHDLMWGGAAYAGADAQYYQHRLQNPYEIVFSCDGQALAPGRVLWDVSSTNNGAIGAFGSESQALTTLARRFLPIILTALGAVLVFAFVLARRTRNRLATSVFFEHPSFIVAASTTKTHARSLLSKTKGAQVPTHSVPRNG
jgi:hypothetical protein